MISMHEQYKNQGATAPDTGVLLAIDVGGTKTQIAACHPGSKRLKRRRLATHSDGLRGAAALQRIIDAALDCVAELGSHRALSVAAVFPGVVRGSTLLMAPNTPGFEHLDLAQLLAQGLSSDAVTLDNDVKAGALAEARWGALKGIDNALYLNLGTGISAAAIVNGRLMRGHNGASMEIGYMLSPFLDADNAQDWKTFSDGCAPLEELFSGTALTLLASEMLGSGKQALDLFDSQAPAVRRALEHRIAACAIQVVNLAVALDVGRIAIGGGLYRQASILVPLLKDLIHRAVPFPPEIVAAQFTDDAPLWGALSMAMDAAGLSLVPEQMLAEFDAQTIPVA